LLLCRQKHIMLGTLVCSVVFFTHGVLSNR
jgi:hypothetical protein